jgi:HEAT repeat protein
MFLRLILTVTVLCSWSSMVSAQLDLPPAPKPGTVEAEPVVTGSKEAVAGQQPAGFFANPDNKVEVLFNDFEAEEKITTDDYARYLEKLRRFGLSSRATALKALFSDHARSVELAAEILEWVGQLADAEQLINAASIAANIEAVSKCLYSATSLHGGSMPPMAASLLDHPRRQVRTLIEARLGESLQEEYLPKFLQFIEFGRDSNLRLRAARLLTSYSNNSEVRQALRKALNDESVSVALQAVIALVGGASEIEVSALQHEFVDANNDTEASYLLFGLLQAQENRSESVLDPSLEPRMREMSQRKDIFISAIASAGLAEQLFRSQLLESLKDLEEQLIYNLVRAVGGIDFYPQYARFSGLAQGSLRRVTGESMLGEPASAWIKWYEANKANLQLVRGRIDIAPLDLPRLRVSITQANGEAKVLCGNAAPFVYGNRIIGSAGQSQVFAMLNEYSILKATIHPGDLGLGTAPLNLTLEVTLGEQRKVLRFRGSAGEPWLSQLVSDFNEIYADTGWQTLASSGADGLAFIMQHLDEFDSSLLDPASRGELLLNLSAGLMATLDDIALSAWLSELSQLSQRQELWTPSMSTELYAIAQARAANFDIASACIKLALTDTSSALFATAIDAAISQQESLRAACCEMVLNRYPLEELNLALTDGRELVRLSAINVLNSRGVAAASTIEAALSDESIDVLHAALHSLGELRAASSLPAVNAFVGAEYDDTTRSIALKTIGTIGDVSSLQLLSETSRDFSAVVRAASVEAISKIDGEEATTMLRDLFADFAGTPLESGFQHALFMRGAASCRLVLRPYILDPSNAELSYRAAIIAGLAGEPAAAPSLMQLLAEQPRSEEILNSLVSATGSDNRRQLLPAGVYSAWWAANSDELPRNWLRNGLVASGFELDEFFDDPTRCATKLSVEQLLNGLQSGPVRLRALCAYFLFNLTGVDAQVILDGTPSAELLRRAQPWQDWLDNLD